ncbi:MAG: SDR family NAD(P)-dependent oxidoreductase [Micromonosporaceae bacterium]|nr:SDR family NAD(P)-dependent oxidoreductase [Micromonosporaceae bacterium]
MARRTALVTGGTAGIGAAFARQLAAGGYDLLLVARDEARLRARADELAAAHDGCQVAVLPADLATEAGIATVAARVADHPPDLLVNSAGTSLNRSFLQSSPEAEERLLRLNVHAVMRLTLAALPGMVERRHGGVVNVSSVAGFAAALMPGSTYPAGKAWVTSFSESVAQSVRRYGVRVLALCPGYVRTEFHQRAGIDMSRTPRRLWLEADAVAADGLRALARGDLVRVVDWRYRMIVGGIRFVPRRVLRAAVRDTRGRIRGDQR